MKSNDMRIQEVEYLPRKSMDVFAASYFKSFPELKLSKSALKSFLNRKFQPLENDLDCYNIAVLITDKGIVASGYGMVRNQYTYGLRNLSVGLVCDVFTNVDFRQMGLFKRVSLLAIRREQMMETNFLIGFPVRDEVMPGHLSVGWKHIFDMPLWWGLPRFGFSGKVTKNPTLNASMFDSKGKGISLEPSSAFLKWRFSLFAVDYYLVSVPSSTDFAIVRKAKMRKVPFTCIIYMQTTNARNSRILARSIRNLSLRLGTFGVIGCWNDNYAKDLFLSTSGLRKSSKYQKVIVRELNGFKCPNDEDNYRLSWMDSDTL